MWLRAYFSILCYMYHEYIHPSVGRQGIDSYSFIYHFLDMPRGDILHCSIAALCSSPAQITYMIRRGKIVSGEVANSMIDGRFATISEWFTVAVKKHLRQNSKPSIILFPAQQHCRKVGIAPTWHVVHGIATPIFFVI